MGGTWVSEGSENQTGSMEEWICLLNNVLGYMLTGCVHIIYMLRL